jgi:ABC-type molybdate transport system permease subunit
MSDLGRAILLSLRISVLATLLTCAVAVPLAFVLARRRVPGRSIIETLLTVPLVLPPTVVGYALIATLGAQSWIGRWTPSLQPRSSRSRCCSYRPKRRSPPSSASWKTSRG